MINLKWGGKKEETIQVELISLKFLYFYGSVSRIVEGIVFSQETAIIASMGLRMQLN